MCNFTFEDYKTAIRAQYKIAITEDVSGILSDPTPAQLRDFYLRLFEIGLSNADQEIMKMFLGTNESSSLKKSIENCNIGKLKPIISFLQGGNTENRSRIEMAAILVNFQLRPFRKFQDEKDIIQKNESIQKSLVSDLITIKNEIKEDSKSSADKEKKNEHEETPPISLLGGLKVNTEDKSPIKLNWKHAIIVASIFLFIAFVVIFFAFPNKDCMQWSGDHYELVDCDLKIQGFGTVANIEIFDPTLINLKKIKVCDTTTCFDKNGTAIIWYAKTANGVDFFDAHGRHPENNSPLRPVTRYILNKYAKR